VSESEEEKNPYQSPMKGLALFLLVLKRREGVEEELLAM